MSDQFYGEIRMFAFNFAPRGWAWCDGQLMLVEQNRALFALLGTTYGGDGKTTFALPNLGRRAPMHPGQGPGLSLRDLGESGGSETVTLLESHMPAHSHTLRAASTPGDSPVPSDNALARYSNAYQQDSTSNLTAMHSGAVYHAGSSIPHNNMQPYLTVNFCIALEGIFPPRD